MEFSLPPCCRGLLCRTISNSPVGKKARKSNSLKGKRPWAKAGIELGREWQHQFEKASIVAKLAAAQRRGDPAISIAPSASDEPPPPAASTTSAAAAAAAASATSVAASAASAASVAAVATAVSGKLQAGLGCSGVFLVEDVERRQADVSDFLLKESVFVSHSRVLRRHIRCRPTGYRGCAARQRQRQPGGSQQRHGACSTRALCSFLRARHDRVLPHLRATV